MKDDNKKCRIDWCENKQFANGFCSRHNHYHYKSGDFGGVYKITLDDNFYIGKAEISVIRRLKDEESALRNNTNQTVAKELLDHFNYVCKKEYGEDNYLDMKLRNKVIERMKFEIIIERYPFYKADGSIWKDKKEMKDRLHMWHIKYKDGKMNKTEKEWYKKYLYMIDMNETNEIRKYRQEDIKNGTHKLLNKNKLGE